MLTIDWAKLQLKVTLAGNINRKTVFGNYLTKWFTRQRVNIIRKSAFSTWFTKWFIRQRVTLIYFLRLSPTSSPAELRLHGAVGLFQQRYGYQNPRQIHADKISVEILWRRMTITEISEV